MDPVRTVIKVTNNKDSGAGSLRAALAKAQKGKDSPTHYDIVFESDSNADNSLQTGYFTIRLKSPLRLRRNNVRINHINPRSVVLVPWNASTGQNVSEDSKSFQTSLDVPNGSLFVLGTSVSRGDPLLIRPQSFEESYTGQRRPQVSFNHVHLIRNNARGSRGEFEGGGGGGAAAGGGILVFDGDLEVKNSTFQDLSAQGGAGDKKPNTGGDGGRYQGPKVQIYHTSGKPGGTGGLPSWVSASTTPLQGGKKGGAKGRTINPSLDWCWPNRLTRPDSDTPYRGKAGDRGESWSNRPPLIGFGGGGAAGGGGGGWYHFSPQGKFEERSAGWNTKRRDHKSCYKNWMKIDYPGGSVQGRGGKALWGGEGGGQNGGRWLRINGDRKEVDGTIFPGKNGRSIGGAISYLGRLDKNTVGPRTRIILENVDFVNNYTLPRDSSNSFGSQLRGMFDSELRESSSRFQLSVYVDDVRVKTGAGDFKKVNADNLRQGRGRVAKKSENPFLEKDEVFAPQHYALSEPTNPSVVAIRNKYLRGENGLADTFVIGFETAGTKIGLTQDLTDPNNPLNKVWETLQPDQEDKIYADYYAEMQSIQAELDKGFLEYWGSDAAKGAAKGAVANLGEQVGGNLAKKYFDETGGTFASVVGGPVTGFALDMAIAGFSYQARKKELYGNLSNLRSGFALDEKLEQNRIEQDDLQQYLREASVGQLASFNTNQSRSRVIVRDFEIGRDIVVMPGDPNVLINSGNEPELDVELGNYGGGQQISFSFKGSNMEFLTIRPTRESLQQLGRNNLQSYINSLITYSEANKTFTLGAQVPDLAVQQERSWTGGPADTQLVIERGQRFSSREILESHTKGGSDQVFGTNGNERIRTEDGRDVIYPAGGKDLVNGGGGEDLVDYAMLSKPVKIKSFVSGDFSGNPNEAKVTSLVDNSIDSHLVGIEDFDLYAESVVDLSGFKSKNRYSVHAGLGSTLRGSAGDDYLILSTDPYYSGDDPIANYSPALIKGRDGYDVVEIKSDKKYSFSYEFVDESRVVFVKAIHNNRSFDFLEANGIEALVVNDSEVDLPWA